MNPTRYTGPLWTQGRTGYVKHRRWIDDTGSVLGYALCGAWPNHWYPDRGQPHECSKCALRADRLEAKEGK